MILEGVVTNVAAFGAFVDVGVHQDGLVHVSAMAERFVSDPHEVVKSGQVVRVKVLEVDVDRQRIGLSLRLNDEPQADRGKRPDRPAAARGGSDNKGRGDKRGVDQRKPNQPRTSAPREGRREANPPAGALAQALRDAGFGK
jgi:protein Tex